MEVEDTVKLCREGTLLRKDGYFFISYSSRPYLSLEEEIMPVRFRRTLTLFPGVKLNVSKGGMSVTVGKKGFHLNFSKRGVRQTTGIPGSEISHTSYLFKNDSEEDNEKENERSSEERITDQSKRRTRREARERASTPWGFFLFVLIAVVFIYFGADALGLLPPNLADFFQILARWAQQTGL